MVGAKKIILELGVSDNLWTANIKAIIVFPNPVGMTTKQFVLRQFIKIFSWYALLRTKSSFKSGWDIKSSLFDTQITSKYRNETLSKRYRLEIY